MYYTTTLYKSVITYIIPTLIYQLFSYDSVGWQVIQNYIKNTIVNSILYYNSLQHVFLLLY